jgi:hypothetical protein
LAFRLRQEGIINTAGKAFEASDSKEIDDLLAQDVFRYEKTRLFVFWHQGHVDNEYIEFRFVAP